MFFQILRLLSLIPILRLRIKNRRIILRKGDVRELLDVLDIEHDVSAHEPVALIELHEAVYSVVIDRKHYGAVVAGELDMLLELHCVVWHPLIGKIVPEAGDAVAPEHEGDAVVAVYIVFLRSLVDILLRELLAVLLRLLLPLLGGNLPDCGEKRLVKEMRHSRAVGCRDLENLAHAEAVEVRYGGVRISTVNLVGDQEYFLVELPELLADDVVSRNQTLVAVNHEDDDVGLAHCLDGLPGHKGLNALLSAVNSARVDDDIALAVGIGVPVLAIACQAGEVRNQGIPGTCQAVENRRLSDIGTPCKGYYWYHTKFLMPQSLPLPY